MRILTLVLGALLLALAAAPVANALVRPEWVVVRWVNADCKIWHNDTNAPVGYGWRPVAFASTWAEPIGRWCGSIVSASADSSHATLAFVSPGIRREFAAL